MRFYDKVVVVYESIQLICGCLLLGDEILHKRVGGDDENDDYYPCTAPCLNRQSCIQGLA